jgi:hypothetical protein
MVPDKKGQERTIELSLTSVRERVIIIIILRVKNTYEKNINLIVAPSEKPGTASDGCEDICFSHEKCEKQISSHPSEIKKKTVFQNNTY